jgi:hypothetical protein
MASLLAAFAVGALFPRSATAQYYKIDTRGMPGIPQKSIRNFAQVLLLLVKSVLTSYILPTDQILESARTLAYDMILFYKGNQSGEIPGILPGPPTEHKGDYYWWEGGAMMGTYVDYWHLSVHPGPKPRLIPCLG